MSGVRRGPARGVSRCLRPGVAPPDGRRDRRSRAASVGRPGPRRYRVPRRSGEREFFVVKRPPDGLLAGLWEFPSVELSDGAAPDEAIDGFLGGQVGWDDRAWEARRLESFTHLFSHIEMSIEPYVHLHGADGSADGGALERPARWVAGGELDEVPMSAAMRRVERSARDALDG
ncbi:MAG: NUDIX domain-containing protein [Bradymonadaceae bacterium]